MKLVRAVLILIGIAFAAAGGVVAYRAAFIEPRTAVVLSAEGAREVPNTPRIVGGLGLSVIGVALGVYAARRRRA